MTIVSLNELNHCSPYEDSMDTYDKELATEINKHKWIESEKAGRDIGLRVARVDWLINHWKSFVDNFDKRNS